MEIYAHRGFSGKYPENTMLAFQKAYDVGVDGIELDVQMTKDGEIVVIHDERIDRTTNGIGYVKDFLYKQLRLFDAGSWFHDCFARQRIPALREVLEWVQNVDKKIMINIELKNNVIDYPHLEEKLLKMIEQFQLEKQVILSSFNIRSMGKVRQLHPTIHIGTLFAGVNESAIQSTKLVNAQAIHGDLSFVLSSEGKEAATQGMKLRVYTVNDAKVVPLLRNAKVSALMTDFPNELMAERCET
ncbi:glycerophosphoryl diester phosphodiesterase [Anoxybacillus vitaminiphilus]|uniref:Glycerophosphoryl diester phosphodiesterase n=1 Tax=Paranoxybacillus vitaminiphilus TaxID=581036 RepID=A0A327YKA0_9BACL|nr:glycerophosphodiester phosphodiesterase [Anoxybacillus vitaminiphilus]RAK18709.1 glycerophosphoryl diester phosphodiesterase [Anoxybacillus vitaminiphilus]